VEGAIVTVPLDPYLSLKALSRYGGLSVRTLRGYLTDPVHPLPHYRINRKLLVRRSEFDHWISRYRQCGRPDLDALVNEVVEDVRKKSPTPPVSH
jgi:lambda repressor-like predicted transcriptional regulator